MTNARSHSLYLYLEIQLPVFQNAPPDLGIDLLLDHFLKNFSKTLFLSAFLFVSILVEQPHNKWPI